MFGHKRFFLQFSCLIFKWETKFGLGIFVAKPYFKHFIRRLNPWNLLWPHKGKTLKSQLLKKPLIEFYETQDLSSTHGKPKLLFYDYSRDFFSPANCRGELCFTIYFFMHLRFHDIFLLYVNDYEYSKRISWQWKYSFKMNHLYTYILLFWISD